MLNLEGLVLIQIICWCGQLGVGHDPSEGHMHDAIWSWLMSRKSLFFLQVVRVHEIVAALADLLLTLNTQLDILLFSK